MLKTLLLAHCGFRDVMASPVLKWLQWAGRHFIRHKSGSTFCLRHHHNQGCGVWPAVKSLKSLELWVLCHLRGTYVRIPNVRELGDGRATSCSAGVMCQERVLRRENHAKDGTYARIGSPMFHCLR